MLHSQSEPRAEERRAYRIPDFCWRYGVSRSTGIVTSTVFTGLYLPFGGGRFQ